MEYLKFILYGLIQGLTEFIPVSSTAHLKVISLFLGIDDPGASLSAIIQLGSVLAIAWYFRKDIFYSRNFFEDWHLKLKISFLKYQAIAKTLPSWIVADKDAPGSSIPKKNDITFKWAVLLTGINSVIPWIKPYKINLKYSKNFLNRLIY